MFKNIILSSSEWQDLKINQTLIKVSMIWVLGIIILLCIFSFILHSFQLFQGFSATPFMTHLTCTETIGHCCLMLVWVSIVFMWIWLSINWMFSMWRCLQFSNDIYPCVLGEMKKVTTTLTYISQSTDQVVFKLQPNIK